MNEPDERLPGSAGTCAAAVILTGICYSRTHRVASEREGVR